MEAVCGTWLPGRKLIHHMVGLVVGPQEVVLREVSGPYNRVASMKGNLCSLFVLVKSSY